MTEHPLRLAFSPCPNDTFVFHAWVHGLVPGAPAVTVDYADVDVTNTAAAQGRYDVVKVSYAALPYLLDEYALLPCGGALGRGCGPLLLTRDPLDASGARQALARSVVAVPGERTTAYLLFRLWSAGVDPRQVVVVPFHEIMPGVAAGRYDLGLVIHEARFTYPRHGLHAAVDLGAWWEADTGLPIPLGAVLARRSLDTDAVAGWLRDSVRRAWADPTASRDYVLAHAQETEPDVVARHIDLYVNAFTENLGAEGHAAVDTLLARAATLPPAS